MSPRTSIWGACRALAIRSRPVAPRSAPFIQSLPRNRWYSSQGNDHPPKAIDNSQEARNSQAGSEPKEEVSAAENGEVEVGLGSKASVSRS